MSESERLFDKVAENRQLRKALEEIEDGVEHRSLTDAEVLDICRAALRERS